MMEESVRELIAKAPDLAQPIEEFAYKYQQWLIELEATLAESEAGQMVNFAEVVEVLKKQWPWFTFSAAALAEYLGVEAQPATAKAGETSGESLLDIVKELRECKIEEPPVNMNPLVAKPMRKMLNELADRIEDAAGRAASGGQRRPANEFPTGFPLHEVSSALAEKREELVCHKHDVYYDPENKRCVICELMAAPAAAPELSWEQVQELRRIFDTAPGGRANRQTLIDNVNALLKSASTRIGE